MKGKSLKFKVKSCFRKLLTSHFSLFTDKRGFTLIEVIMIIVVVAIAIPALLIILGQEAKQSVNAELQVSATNVGQALMEEIKTKRWDENATIPPNFYSTALVSDGTECRTICTGLPCGANPPYDDVDDYNGYIETCGNYTTSVSVCYVQPTALDTCVALPPPNTNSGYDYKRIQVTVTNANFGSVELVTVVTNY